jgi:DNA-binding Lrp family transcriptional regulator
MSAKGSRSLRGKYQRQSDIERKIISYLRKNGPVKMSQRAIAEEIRAPLRTAHKAMRKLVLAGEVKAVEGRARVMTYHVEEDW